MSLKAGKTGHAQNSFEQANDSGFQGNLDVRRTCTTLGILLSKAHALSAHAEPVGILAGVSSVRDNAVKAVE